MVFGHLSQIPCQGSLLSCSIQEFWAIGKTDMALMTWCCYWWQPSNLLEKQQQWWHEMVFFVLADQEVACSEALMLGGILKQALSCYLNPGYLLHLVLPGSLLRCFKGSRDDESREYCLQRSLCRDGSRDHDIWLLFTINTYLMLKPPLSVQDFVSPDWFRPSAKCLYLMRVGNPDKCSIIRGNRKTRWISAEDLLCVNTKIYHPTKRSFFCFPFHFETFS